MAEDHTPPGDPVARNGRRTLRDLVDSHAPGQAGAMETFLATGDAAAGGSLRLGFPSGEQLTRFVAGQHARIFAHLDLPRPLRHTSGAHLERRRFFAGGRVAAPDLVFTGPTGELVIVFTASPLTMSTRLPDPHALEVVASLDHVVHGILVTPDPDPDTSAWVADHLASLVLPMQWVRYRIDLTILE